MTIQLNLPNKKSYSFLNCKRHNYFGHKKLAYLFSDVFLLNNTILDKDKRVIESTLHEQIFWQPECICKYYNNDILFNQELAKRTEVILKRCDQKSSDTKFIDISNTCIDLTHPFGCYAFGHLFDTLQRLYPIRELLYQKDIKFIVSKYDNIIDFIKHLSILTNRLITEKDLILSDNLHILKLIYSISPTVPTELDKEAYEWILNKYFNYFGIEKTEPKHNLYLTRNHVEIGSRGVINEEETREVLEKKDFIILTGKEPLKDIVTYFANAKTIVGAHGSLFVNTMFCNPETKIIELCPHNRICYNFRNFLKMAQNYNHVIIEADERYNITIDLNKLLRIYSNKQTKGDFYMDYNNIKQIIEKTEGLMHKHVETQLLFNLASNLPEGKNILEIGSFKGLSSVCLGLGLKQTKGELFCISRWSEEQHNAWKDNMQKNNIRAIQIAGDANIMLKHLTIENLGMIFIDTGHSYEDCKIQFELATRNLKNTCLVAFHDYGHPNYPGVKQYCDELVDNGIYKNTNLVSTTFYGYVNEN
jgi:predicted O-methyltransferase YrrM